MAERGAEGPEKSAPQGVVAAVGSLLRLALLAQDRDRGPLALDDRSPGGRGEGQGFGRRAVVRSQAGMKGTRHAATESQEARGDLPDAAERKHADVAEALLDDDAREDPVPEKYVGIDSGRGLVTNVHRMATVLPASIHRWSKRATQAGACQRQNGGALYLEAREFFDSRVPRNRLRHFGLARASLSPASLEAGSSLGVHELRPQLRVRSGILLLARLRSGVARLVPLLTARRLLGPRGRGRLLRAPLPAIDRLRRLERLAERSLGLRRQVRLGLRNKSVESRHLVIVVVGGARFGAVPRLLRGEEVHPVAFPQLPCARDTPGWQPLARAEARDRPRARAAAFSIRACH